MAEQRTLTDDNDVARSMLYYDRWGQAHKPDGDSLVRRRAGAFALCVTQDHLLMIKGLHAPKNYELPGGGIDEGETIWQALCREVQEESGLDLQCPESMPQIRQQVHFFAEDKCEYWVYDQVYYVLRGKDIDSLFKAESWKTPEDGMAIWMPLSNVKQKKIPKKDDADSYHYIHYNVIEQLILEQE